MVTTLLILLIILEITHEAPQHAEWQITQTLSQDGFQNPSQEHCIGTDARWDPPLKCPATTPPLPGTPR